MSVFQVIGLGLKFMGGMQAAKAQEQASKDNAEAMVTDRIVGEAFDDLTVMARQSDMESRKQTVASLLEVERGKNRAAATRINTMSSFASGLHDLQASMAIPS